VKTAKAQAEPGADNPHIVKMENGKALITPVETAYYDETFTVVSSRVSVRDIIISGNFLRLKKSTQIKILPM